ncbi:unnamed protein product [Rotaria socialis]|uniref:G-protein coupled receptors family 1 profile domain-containing protein n=1 Tax=Rotaria socialis TaxID=392032 RepID=A0A818EGY6_9BILA|nr:unnamed protein product [Rotaria socialis]CAF3364183.1 unnamed protein product [Rotaria socialis]CAF3379289.1 unnamed protein product [Rotaria socialis]CAF3458471.1 unnamed protein product [Rotaria socialis]CAF3657973.1 unnamed protein product [Rotaria socialis]
MRNKVEKESAFFDLERNPNKSEVDSFESLYDALRYVGLTSGLHINETVTLPPLQSKWSSTINILPLGLGCIGLVFNILALLIFSTSKTFRKTSFRFYIYAFALVNCASVLTHSWLYLIFYLVDPKQFCKFLQYFQQSTATTSLWIMTLLTLERSLTLSLPYTVKRFLQTRTTCFMLILVTVLCFALHIDEIISVDVKAFRWVNFAYGICSVKRHFHLLTERIKIVTHANSFMLPFLFNSILDIYICYKICERRKILLAQSSIVSTTSVYNKRKYRRFKKSLAHEITLSLLCQSLWLLFTYFPTHLYYFLISFKVINDHDRDNSTFNFLTRQNLLIYLAFSPALYVILSPTLRNEIHSYLSQLYRQHRSFSLSTTANPQKKLRSASCNIYHQQKRYSERFSQINSTFSKTKCKHIRGKFLSKSIALPFTLKYESKSVPCLTIYNNQQDYDQDGKIERSNTSDAFRTRPSREKITENFHLL